jgi:hypothetical protein
MQDINLREIIQESDSPSSYLLFRTIEDWCCDNLDKTKWRFDNSIRMCVCGIDVPGRIIFKRSEDATIFLYRFTSELPLDLKTML